MSTFGCRAVSNMHTVRHELSSAWAVGGGHLMWRREVWGGGIGGHRVGIWGGRGAWECMGYWALDTDGWIVSGYGGHSALKHIITTEGLLGPSMVGIVGMVGVDNMWICPRGGSQWVRRGQAALVLTASFAVQLPAVEKNLFCSLLWDSHCCSRLY